MINTEGKYMSSKSDAALGIALAQINKKYGDGAVMKLGDTDFDKTMEKI